MVLCHYTSRRGYQSISRTRQFAPSDPWTTMDAAYGSGWYFTDITPSGCDYAIMEVCWGRTDVHDRIAYYLKFDIPLGLFKKCRANVYVVAEWREEIRYLQGGMKPVCSLKPCSTCDLYQKYYGRK